MAAWSNLAGTVLGYIRLGLTGVRLKNSAGELAVRNAGDTADAKIQIANGTAANHAVTKGQQDDIGYGAVGCIAMVGSPDNPGAVFASGATMAGTLLKTASVQNGVLVYGPFLTGTWRNLGPDIANVINWYTTMQRIS